MNNRKACVYESARRKAARIFALSLATMTLMVAHGATYEWIGAAGEVDWSAAASWKNASTSETGILPGDTDDVVFPFVVPDRLEFRITVPSGFAGTISSRKYENSWYAIRCRLEVQPSSEAGDYKLKGDGVYVANESLSEHLATDFSGAIDIPSGVTFTASSDVPAGVEFFGAGTLVVDSAARFAHLGGFTGTIDARGIGSLTSTDLTTFAGHDVLLPATTTIDGTKMMMLGSQLDDWNTADAWAFRGVSRTAAVADGYVANDTIPAVQADGSLLMTDDFAQRQTATLMNRTFTKDDVWQVKFTWTPSHDADAHPLTWDGASFWGQGQWGNMCGAGIVSTGSLADGALPVATGDSACPAGMSGWRSFGYTGAGQQSLGLLGGGAGIGNSDQWTCAMRESDCGINLRKSIEVTMTFVKAHMYITFRQGTVSRTIDNDISTFISKTFKFGFFANSAGSTWQWNKFSDFSGWCYQKSDDDWVANPDYAGSFNDWNLEIQKCQDNGAGSQVTLTGASDCLDAGGRLPLCGAQRNFAGHGSGSSPVDITKRNKFKVHLDWGTSDDLGTGSHGEGIRFMFRDSNANIWGNGVNIWYFTGTYPAWIYYYYGRYSGFTTQMGTSWTQLLAGDIGNLWASNNSSIDLEFVVWGGDTMSVKSVRNDGTVEEGSATFPTPISEYYSGKTTLYPVLLGASAAWLYRETWASNFVGYVWKPTNRIRTFSNLALPAGGSLAVNDAVAVESIGTAGAVTLAAGADSSLSCSDFRLGGVADGGTVVSLSGDVRLGDSLRVEIPKAWKTSRAKACLLDTAGSTAQIPATLDVVYDDGDAVPSRYISVKDGKLLANFAPGLVIFVQ